jgi:subtilisin family serine protease
MKIAFVVGSLALAAGCSGKEISDRQAEIESNSVGGETHTGEFIASVENITSDECTELHTKVLKVCSKDKRLRSLSAEPVDHFDELCTFRFPCHEDIVFNALTFIDSGDLERSRQVQIPREMQLDPTDTAENAADKSEEETLLKGKNHGADWGLNRIANQDGSKYSPSYTGKGVNIYMVDTGARSTHKEFAGRYTLGKNFIKSESPEDTNGHGTHTAGTAAGSSYGVAPEANLIGIKVFGKRGSGNIADIASAIKFATKYQNKNHGGKPAVINLSLTAGRSKAIEKAAKTAVKHGMIVVAAAGNEGFAVTEYVTPAYLGGKADKGNGVITVMASTKNDKLAKWSNFGAHTDIIAPGDKIRSAWFTSDTATHVDSGTSMASPHVAGVAAQLLEKNDFDQVAAQKELFKVAVSGKIENIKNSSPNLLLQIPA